MEIIKCLTCGSLIRESDWTKHHLSHEIDSGDAHEALNVANPRTPNWRSMTPEEKEIARRVQSDAQEIARNQKRRADAQATPRRTVPKTPKAKPDTRDGLTIGDRVRSASLGEGRILGIEGPSGNVKVSVSFDTGKQAKVLSSFLRKI